MRLRRIEPHLRRAFSGPCRLPSGAGLLVAVSGGADSTALLAGLARIAPEFGLTLHGHGLLTLGLCLCDQGSVGSLGLLQIPLAIGDDPLGFELGLFGTATLLRGHNIGVRLRLCSRLAPPCLSDLGLDLLDVE